MTQVPVLLLVEEKQPAIVTQVPVLTLYQHKPVPLPEPLVPEVPVVETWKWVTVLSTAETSKEQRASLRAEPRYQLDLEILIEDFEERRKVYNLIMRYLKIVFVYPFYQYSVKLTSAVAAGGTKLYCDTTKTDVRAGEQFTLYRVDLSETVFVEADSVDSDGINLSAGLDFDVDETWMICPATSFRMLPVVGFDMDSVSGSFKVTMESVQPRDFNVTADAGLTFIDGLLIVKERPLAPQSEEFDFGVTWFDNDTSIPTNYQSWSNAHVQGPRAYMFDRYSKMGYWRSVADYFCGMKKTGLFPTFMEDLPLVGDMALNSNNFITSNVNFFTFWLEPIYRYVRIDTKNGVKYRRIANVEPIFDDEGFPYQAKVTLSQSIGNVAGDNVINMISFMNMCRLNGDEIKLTHDYVDTTIEFTIKGVNA